MQLMKLSGLGAVITWALFAGSAWTRPVFAADATVLVEVSSLVDQFPQMSDTVYLLNAALDGDSYVFTSSNANFTSSGIFRGHLGSSAFDPVAILNTTPSPNTSSPFLHTTSPRLDGDAVTFYGIAKASPSGPTVGGFYTQSQQGEPLFATLNSTTAGLSFSARSSVDQGQLAFNSRPATPAPTDGLYLVPLAGGTPTSLITVNTPRPDSLSGGKFTDWASPSPQALSGSQLAFIANNNRGLYTITADTSPQVLVNDQTPRPEGGIFFGTFFDVGRDGDNIAFLFQPSSATGGNLYGRINGQMYLIGQRGASVPGGGGAVFAEVAPYNVISESSFAIDGDRVVFLARYDDGRMGAYLFEDGTTSLLLQAGDFLGDDEVFDLAMVPDSFSNSRVILTASLGLTPASARVALLMVNIPEPASLAILLLIGGATMFRRR